MRYFAAMAMLIPTMAMIALSSAAAQGTERVERSVSPAMRFAQGPSVEVTIRARIIRSAARVGAGFAPAEARMVPRRTTVSAADGRLVPSLVYDFE